jgi:hypothetical protein
VFEAIVKYLVGEARVIKGAPVSFVACTLVAGFIIWFALDWKYSSLISNRDSVITNKDSQIALVTGERDNYREKLNGASPDQAKARIDALEAKVASLAGCGKRHHRRALNVDCRRVGS